MGESMDEQSAKQDEPSGEPTPFDRFERFAKRLVAVPKAEIDARRKAEKPKRRRPASS